MGSIHKGLPFAPLRVEAELSCLHALAPPYILLRRTSETPTTTTSQKSIAIHLQFVLQYASNLYCSTFGAPTL